MFSNCLLLFTEFVLREQFKQSNKMKFFNYKIGLLTKCFYLIYTCVKLTLVILTSISKLFYFLKNKLKRPNLYEALVLKLPSM